MAMAAAFLPCQHAIALPPPPWRLHDLHLRVYSQQNEALVESEDNVACNENPENVQKIVKNRMAGEDLWLSSRRDYSLTSTLRKYLFISPNKKSKEVDGQPTWPQRRGAMLILQTASDIGSALANVGHTLQVTDLNLVMRRLVKLERWDAVYQLFNWMEEQNKANAPTYASFFVTLGKLGQAEKALRIFNRLTSQELQTSIYVCNAILSTLIHNGRQGRALELFYKLQKDGLEPDIVTYSTVIFGCKNIMDGHKKARQLYEEMKASGLQPEEYVYGALLNVYTSHGQETDALALFDEMRSEGIMPNLFHYSYLINMYAMKRCPAEAEQIFLDLKNSGLEPNMVLYNAMVNVYMNNRLFDKGMMIFYEMQASDIQPDLPMYSSVMDAYAKEGDASKCLELFKEMKERGFVLGGYAYGTLISVFANNGDIEMVEKLESESNNRAKGKSDIRLFNALLKAYCQLKKNEGIERTLRRMDDEGIIHTRATFNILIDHLCKEGMLNLAISSFKDMRARGIRPNTATYDLLIEYLSNPSKMEDGGELSPENDQAEPMVQPEEKYLYLDKAYVIFKDMQVSKRYCSIATLEKFIRANAAVGNWEIVLEAAGKLRELVHHPSQDILDDIYLGLVGQGQYEMSSTFLQLLGDWGCKLSDNVREVSVMEDQSSDGTTQSSLMEEIS